MTLTRNTGLTSHLPLIFCQWCSKLMLPKEQVPSKGVRSCIDMSLHWGTPFEGTCSLGSTSLEDHSQKISGRWDVKTIFRLYTMYYCQRLLWCTGSPSWSEQLISHRCAFRWWKMYVDVPLPLSGACMGLEQQWSSICQQSVLYSIPVEAALDSMYGDWYLHCSEALTYETHYTSH